MNKNRKLVAILLATIFCLSSSVVTLASDTKEKIYPSKVESFKINGKPFIKQSYFVDEKKESYPFLSKSFEQENYKYSIDNIEYEEIIVSETKEVKESRTQSIQSKNNALWHFDEFIDYSEESIEESTDGTKHNKTDDISETDTSNIEDDSYFSGALYRKDESLTIEASGYSKVSKTKSDSTYHYGLSSTDTSNINKTIVRNDVTLHLTNVDWSTSYDSSVEVYNAVAHYSGTYTESVVKGYIASIEYEGTVTKETADGYKITVFYLGEEIPEPEPITEVIEEKENTKTLPIVILVLVLLLCLVGAGIFLMKPNLNIYNMHDGVYELLDRRRINVDSPVIDLGSLQEKSHSSIYKIVISKDIALKLIGKEVTVSLNHKIISETVNAVGTDGSSQKSGQKEFNTVN